MVVNHHRRDEERGRVRRWILERRDRLGKESRPEWNVSAGSFPRTGRCTATRTGRPLSSWRGALATFRNSCATTRAQRRSARTDEDDIAVFLVPSSAPGLRVRLHKHLDLTRRCVRSNSPVSASIERRCWQVARISAGVYWELGP